MEQGLKMVIGMTLAYVTSFAGLVLAWRSYRKHRKENTGVDDGIGGTDQSDGGGERAAGTEGVLRDD